MTTGDGNTDFGPGSNNPAQDPTNQQGSVLRIDPAGDDFPGDGRNSYSIPPGNPGFGPNSDPSIVVIGTRNPFRMSYDPVYDMFFFGDVGEDTKEEINVLQFGANYGWPAYEGSDPFQGDLSPYGTLTDPVYEYGNGPGEFEGISVAGGAVYRGPISDIVGSYFFGDFSNASPEARVWSFDFSPATMSAGIATRRNFSYDDPGSLLNQVLGFGYDGSNNMYLLDYDGDIFMVSDADTEPSGVVPAPSSAVALVTALGLLSVNAIRQAQRRD
jgi:hypothetical protein